MHPLAFGPVDAPDTVPAAPEGGSEAPLPSPSAAAAQAPGPEAIFVVGVSRSGTTLMSRVLDHHPLIAIAGENHYLRHLVPWMGVRRDVRKLGDLNDDAVVRELARRISEGRLQGWSRLRENSPFWVWLKRKTTREDLEARLLAGERSERGVFTTLLRTYADVKGRTIIGEKTPAHVADADTLLAWYPGARIVHMMRDPRGVYTSEVRRRTENPASFPYRTLVHVPRAMRTFILLETAWAWSQAVARHRDLAHRFPDSYRMVRFEDLVRDPDTTVAALCAFLGVDQHPRMLRQKVVSYGENLGDAGFDASAADRW